MLSCLIKKKIINKNELIQFIEKIFNYGERKHSFNMQNLALFLSSEYILNFPNNFHLILPLIEKWANHEDWRVREGSIYSIRSILKKNKEIAIDLLLRWAETEKENLRRFVAESLRPPEGGTTNGRSAVRSPAFRRASDEGCSDGGRLSLGG